MKPCRHVLICDIFSLRLHDAGMISCRFGKTMAVTLRDCFIVSLRIDSQKGTKTRGKQRAKSQYQIELKATSKRSQTFIRSNKRRLIKRKNENATKEED